MCKTAFVFRGKHARARRRGGGQISKALSEKTHQGLTQGPLFAKKPYWPLPLGKQSEDWEGRETPADFAPSTPRLLTV